MNTRPSPGLVAIIVGVMLAATVVLSLTHP